jgi:uncharacterized cupredoxin-like copper-binding protein
MLLLAPGPAALAGPGESGHAHTSDEFSTGEPADSRKPARIIVVTMRETSRGMEFMPNRLEVDRGTSVRFLLRNKGELEHEFVLGTTQENIRHAEQMRKHPDMEHDDPFARRLAPKRAGELVWRFTRSGVFEFGCLIPGHREAGMTGTIIVRPGLPEGRG